MKLYSSAAYLLPGLHSSNYNEHSIIRDVCDYFEVSVDDIKKKSGEIKAKKNEWVIPRQISMFFVTKNYPNKSQEYVGSLFNRDHATVINALKKVQNLIDTEPRFRIKIEEIHQIISNNKDLFNKNKIDKMNSTGIKYIVECTNNLTGSTMYLSLENEVRQIVSDVKKAAKFLDKDIAKAECSELNKKFKNEFYCTVEKF